MVRTSGIRERLRSEVLKDLAKERGTKRAKPDRSQAEERDESDKQETAKQEHKSEEDEVATLNRLNQERRLKRLKESKSSLLSLLPEPKNSSAFGPTIRLDKLLKMPERADNVELQAQAAEGQPSESCLNADGMLEVDVNKFLTDPMPGAVRELTVEKSTSEAVILPKGKEKQKNQITYLAQLGKATELERKEQAAQGRANRAAARSKYGW